MVPTSSLSIWSSAQSNVNHDEAEHVQSTLKQKTDYHTQWTSTRTFDSQLWDVGGLNKYIMFLSNTVQ